MSKAFQCEKCGVCFPGDPHYVTNDGNEFCCSCGVTLKASGAASVFEKTTDVKLGGTRADRPGY